MNIFKRISLNDNADIRDIDKNFQILENMLLSETIVTIPADDPTDSPYTKETDSDENTYYTIEIPVTGMTSDYVGIGDAQPVLPTPYNVNQNKAIKKLASLITGGESMNGKIKLNFSKKPTSSFQMCFYGV